MLGTELLEVESGAPLEALDFAQSQTVSVALEPLLHPDVVPQPPEAQLPPHMPRLARVRDFLRRSVLRRSGAISEPPAVEVYAEPVEDFLARAQSESHDNLLALDGARQEKDADREKRLGSNANYCFPCGYQGNLDPVTKACKWCLDHWEPSQPEDGFPTFGRKPDIF